MAKFINKKWKVTVNSADLSNHCFGVHIGDETERIDVSGFSATGNREYLPGLAEQVITIDALLDFASGSTFQSVKDLYYGGSVFAVYVQPFSDQSTAATNPIYGGASASVFSFPVEGVLNERAEITLEFRPATNASFAWATA